MQLHSKAIGTANWPNFPTLCTHSYSWPLYSFANGIIGVTSTKINNIIIKPSVPLEIGSFTFNSSFIDIKRDENNNYFIKYKPKTFIGNTLHIIFDLSVIKNDIINSHKWIFEKNVTINKNISFVQFIFDSKALQIISP